MATKEQREERKKQNLCTACGKCSPKEKRSVCEQCGERGLKAAQKNKKKHRLKGLCDCGREKLPNKSRCKLCLNQSNIRSKNRARKQRMECIQIYGGKCQCCGLNVEKYLQLDHKNGGGDDHRREIFGKKTGGAIAKWIIQNNFPPIFQLLCANCHQAKTVNKPCTQEDHNAMRSYCG